MGQTFSLATLSPGSAGIDVPELSDLSYEKSLGQARFMKSVRARHQNGVVVVKLVVKPYPQVDLSKYVEAIRRERDALADVSNALSYQRVLETATNGYLVRQFLYSSLYDRISTRPFLEDIEKKWLAFQLLCALRDCHAKNVFHGDIKTENILVTSWNWLYVTDFSTSFKKTYLPEDNPADFSYYFDTSGRRTCYLAPERFLASGEKGDDRGVTWAMDIFSIGCVVAELFLESPIFSLSQLYKYRKGEFDPYFGYLSKIQDPDVRELVSHMIQLDPESRYSADEYLNFWRRKAFPEYFYSFLHEYMGLITDPSSGRAPVVPETSSFGEADDRIDRVFNDFDKISYFLGFSNEQKKVIAPFNSGQRLLQDAVPVQIDIPNNRHQATSIGRSLVDDGSLIFLTLVVSALRNTARATARIRACDLMLAFAERITDEAKLDRVLPYVVVMLNDRSEAVKMTAIRTIAQLFSLVQVVSPVNAHVYTEYIRPRLQQFIDGATCKVRPFVRATYASCFATLAFTSSRVLELVQALRADGSIPPIDPEAEDGAPSAAGYQTFFDTMRSDLLEHFESHTKALVTDKDASVRRAFLGSVANLCILFGNSKANEVILSHLNTYLNDKDWVLKCAFFQTIVGVATFVGGSGLEDFILPLMMQALTDTEEYVVENVLSSFANMAEIGLFQRSKTWDMVDVVARFLVHPNVWIREAAAHFVSASTTFLNAADIHFVISPLVEPYLNSPIKNFSEVNILGALKKPLSRNVMELAMTWAIKGEAGLFWNPAGQKQISRNFGAADKAVLTVPPKDLRPNALNRIPKNDEDEQWLSRLRNLGMTQDDEIKLLALREYLWHLAPGKFTEELREGHSLGGIKSLKGLNVAPQTIFFEPTRKSIHQGRFSESGHGLRPTLSTTPHTITDALLDASTTAANPLPDRNTLRISSRQERSSGHVSPILIRPVQSQAPSASVSPLSASLAGGKISKDQASHSSGTERSDSNQKALPGYDTERYSSNGTLTPDSLRRGERTYAIKHKSSAIDLLHKKDISKTSAEIGTTVTNAFGRVDGPHKREYKTSSITLEGNGNSNEEPNLFNENFVRHTYAGNDPNVLKLLDCFASENYPVDIMDFGPQVTPVTGKLQTRAADHQDVNKPWRPEGVLVATFGEHRAPINCIVPSPDHTFFLTASDDGSVKVWDSQRLERNLAHRSRQTHRHADGAKVKSITFVESTHTFVSAATDGSINVVKMDHTRVAAISRYGKLRLVRDYQLQPNEHAVCLNHFRADARSVLLVVTNRSRILALDLRSMDLLFSFVNPVHHGTPTCSCLDPRHYWLLLGTSRGILDFWDLRWKLRIRSWGLGGGTPIHRINIHPFHGKGRWVCVAGGTGQTEVTVWDLEKGECREVFRTGGSRNISKDNLKIYDAWKIDEEKPEGMLSRFAVPIEAAGNAGVDRAIRAIALGVDSPEEGRDARYGFLLTGGCDRKLRFWDVTRIELSKVISGLDVDDDQPKYTTSHPTTSLSLYTERTPQPGPSAPNAAASTNQSTKTATKKTTVKPPRSTMISLQQQQLLRNHLDTIVDVAILETPVGMMVSVDRSGVIKVFQ